MPELGVAKHFIDHICIYIYIKRRTCTCILTHISLYLYINTNVYIYTHTYEGMRLSAIGSHMHIRCTGWQ